MQQINNGMLEMLKYVAASQMNPAKAVNSSNGAESEFGKLLERKNSESASESASGKEDTGTKETAEKENVETEKPETEQEEQEVCDVAREAACAQIVWMIPQQDNAEQPVAQGENGEVVDFFEITTIARPFGEPVVNVVEPTPEQPVQEGEIAIDAFDVPQAEPPKEQVIDTVEQTVGTQNETETESGAQFAQDDLETVRKTETNDTEPEVVVTEAPLFKDVEAAPIKVAEAPAKAEAPEVERQVSDKLVKVLESGESRVEIQLNPEALGKVTIELTQNGDGTMNIILNAENAETRGILEKHVTTLHEALVDRGQQNVQIEVSRGEEAQNQNGQQQQQELRDSDGRQQGGQQRREKEETGEDFLQQLRLGLIDMEEKD